MKSAFKAVGISACITAIVHTFMCWIGFLFLALGFEESPLKPFGWTIFNLIMQTLLFIVLGIVYTWAYDNIPGKGIWKGLVFGLVVYLSTAFFTAVYLGIGYGNIVYALGWGVSGLYTSIPFGLAIGYLYKK
jgi:hypothetical protein